jgi:hypothetical protein
LGVAGFRLVSDDAHDVGLTMITDGIAHGLAVYGEAFIVGAVFYPTAEALPRWLNALAQSAIALYPRIPQRVAAAAMARTVERR